MRRTRDPGLARSCSGRRCFGATCDVLLRARRHDECRDPPRPEPRRRRHGQRRPSGAGQSPRQRSPARPAAATRWSRARGDASTCSDCLGLRFRCPSTTRRFSSVWPESLVERDCRPSSTPLAVAHTSAATGRSGKPPAGSSSCASAGSARMARHVPERLRPRLRDGERLRIPSRERARRKLRQNQGGSPCNRRRPQPHTAREHVRFRAAPSAPGPCAANRRALRELPSADRRPFVGGQRASSASRCSRKRRSASE
jgi:hypothetical protein